MKILFNRGYLCCGCSEQINKEDAVFIYKHSCLCKDCFAKIKAYPKLYRFEAVKPVDFLTPIVYYKDLYRDMFLRFKFQSDMACGHIIGQMLEHYLKGCRLFLDYSYIVPVPVSRKRRNLRGFNQTDILAEYVSKALNIPIRKILERVKHSTPQSLMIKRYRSENVKGAFRAGCQLNGENIIIFDDVYTTGSTAGECAKLLIEAGAGSVCAIAAAHNHTEYVDRTIHLFHKS